MNEMTDAERLTEARRLVLEHRRASISLVQRYMRIDYNAAARSAPSQPLKAEQAKDAPTDHSAEPSNMVKEAAEDAPKLWLWQNFVNGRPEYWAFDNPYPINLDNGDPQTLGEPCGYAIFKPSRQGRFDKSEEQVLAAIRAAMAQERKA